MQSYSYTTSDGQYQIIPAEVYDVIHSDANPGLMYSVKVKMLDNTPVSSVSSPSIITAKPLNINSVRIPIKGEVVLLINAPSSYASGTSNATDVYYLDIVSLQSNINHNAIPTISVFNADKVVAAGDADHYNTTNAGIIKKNSSNTPKLDNGFTENPNVLPLYGFSGDVIHSGRYGSSIRFSSTNKTYNKITPMWSGAEGAPITIIRNSAPKKSDKNSIIESAIDDNLIILGSGQSLNFTQSSSSINSLINKGIRSWKSERWGRTPQMLLSSGRIVLNSTQKEVAIFAKDGIGMSSDNNIAISSKNTAVIDAAKIELGDNATEQALLGNTFLELLGTLTIPVAGNSTGTLNSSPQWSVLQRALSQLVLIK